MVAVICGLGLWGPAQVQCLTNVAVELPDAVRCVSCA